MTDQLALALGADVVRSYDTHAHAVAAEGLRRITGPDRILDGDRVVVTDCRANYPRDPRPYSWRCWDCRAAGWCPTEDEALGAYEQHRADDHGLMRVSASTNEEAPCE